jgi:protein TonB
MDRGEHRSLFVPLMMSCALHAAAAVYLPRAAERARPAPSSPLIVRLVAGVPQIHSATPAIEHAPAPPRDSAARDARRPPSRTPERARRPGASVAHANPAATAPVDPTPATPAAPAAASPESSADGRADTPSPSAPVATAAGARGEPGPPVEPPRFGAAYLSNPPPDYPALARRQRLQGTVVLRVLVDAGGRAEELRIDRTSGAWILDEVALAAVRKWRFVPARRGDEAIAHWVDVPVRFRLQD